LVSRWSGVVPQHSVWEAVGPETGLDGEPGPVRVTASGTGPPGP
jgi:hypothetical protein